MRALGGWLKATFDYNPTFPLSALVLLVGLRLLAEDGRLDGATTGGAAAGLSVLQAYEAGLLGLALLVLWPRRIAYETTSILIIFGVVRFAAPFVVTSLAAEGELFGALLLGVGLWALMGLKVGAVQRKVGLDTRRWERGYDLALFGAVCVGMPLCANRLSAWTGAWLDHSQARLLVIGTWWALAVGLAPLALGLDGLGATGPLRSRRPALLWRALSGAGAALLLLNALWLADGLPPLFAVLPLALVAGATAAAALRAAGAAVPSWTLHLPALGLALVVGLPAETLMGPLPPLQQGTAVIAFLLLGAAALPLLAAPKARAAEQRHDVLRGLRSLGAVAALAPLRLAPSLHAAELYVLTAAGALIAVGLWRRRDPLVAHAGVIGAASLAFLCRDPQLPSPALAVELWGAALALAVALRLPAGDGDAAAPASARVALALVVGSGVLLTFGSSAPWTHVSATALSGACLAVLGARQRRSSWVVAAGAVAGGPFTRRLAVGADPGLVLVLLAFAALPAGTWIALRRERARELEPEEFDPLALDDDPKPAFGSPVAARSASAAAPLEARRPHPSPVVARGQAT